MFSKKIETSSIFPQCCKWRRPITEAVINDESQTSVRKSADMASGSWRNFDEYLINAVQKYRVLYDVTLKESTQLDYTWTTTQLITACFVYILWYIAPLPNGTAQKYCVLFPLHACVAYGTERYVAARCVALRCVAYFSKLSLRCIAIRYGRLRSIALHYVALPVARNWAWFSRRGNVTVSRRSFVTTFTGFTVRTSDLSLS